MKTLFQILRWFFYFFTVLVWLFFLRWDLFFSEWVYSILKTCIMPLYFILIWLIIWSLISQIQDKWDSNPQIYTKWFIIGIIIWLILALTYIFL